jgi:hypothetical protein
MRSTTALIGSFFSMQRTGPHVPIAYFPEG